MRYAYDVLDGKIVTGELTKACERFFNDLNRTDLIFREEKAQQFLTFLNICGMSKAIWRVSRLNSCRSKCSILLIFLAFIRWTAVGAFARPISLLHARTIKPQPLQVLNSMA